MPGRQFTGMADKPFTSGEPVTITITTGIVTGETKINCHSSNKNLKNGVPEMAQQLTALVAQL